MSKWIIPRKNFAWCAIEALVYLAFGLFVAAGLGAAVIIAIGVNLYLNGF